VTARVSLRLDDGSTTELSLSAMMSEMVCRACWRDPGCSVLSTEAGEVQRLTSSGFWLTDSRVLWVSDHGHFGKGQARLEWIAKVASFAKSGRIRSASSTLNIWAVIDSREQDTGHDPSAQRCSYRS